MTSLRKAQEEQDAIKRKGVDETDLDVLLTQPELENMAARHWARYKVTLPPEVAPSDMLVSRVSKEIDKRLLSSRAVAKVRTIAQQQRSIGRG